MQPFSLDVANLVSESPIKVPKHVSWFPIPIYEPFEQLNVHVWNVPWVPPPVLAVEFVSIQSQEPVIIVGGEVPLTAVWQQVESTKADLEMLHLKKFCTDHLFAFGTRPFRTHTRGLDPPDYNVETSTGAQGLDCTQFAVGLRRNAFALFQQIRRIILNEPDPSKFQHLRGLAIAVVVPNVAGLGQELPLRVPAHDELIDALANYRFKPETGQMQEDSSLSPDLDVQNTIMGWRFYAMQLGTAFPCSEFLIQTGFELGFVYSTKHTPNNLWDETSRLLSKHDKEGVQNVLITAGGPDRWGFVYPSEYLLTDFMIRNCRAQQLTLNHIKHAILHKWGTGELVQIYPKVMTLFPGYSCGFAPSHFPLRGESVREVEDKLQSHVIEVRP